MNVIVTVATEVSQFPAGTVPAGIVITIPGIAPQTIAAAPYSATFDNVPPGSYTATVQAVDSAGAALGAPMTSAQFEIVAPTVGIDIPSSISVTVQ